jgi:hypothetical protein
MTCKEAREYMLDVAQENAAARLDEHLRGCASCTQELRSMRQTMVLLDEWEAPEPSPYFDSRLRARLREAAAEPRSWLGWLRKPAIAFALALLMVVSITIFRNAPDHSDITKGPKPPVTIQTGTAVSDLQELEHDGDMYANFDMLDDLGTEAETANP